MTNRAGTRVSQSHPKGEGGPKGRVGSPATHSKPPQATLPLDFHPRIVHVPFVPSLPSQPALLDLSRQFGLIWTMLTRGLGLWESRERSSPLPALAYRRASRLVARLQALLALLAAGRLPPVRPPRPPRLAAVAEAPPEAPPQDAPPPRPRPPRLPRRVGWLMARGIEIRWAAGPFQHWLQDPQVQALLAQVPQARRPLAALCRMLAIPPWPHPPDGPLPLPKPRVRKPRPKKPRRPTLAEDRAACWHHRCIETDSGFVDPKRRPWWMPPLSKRR